MMKESSSLRHVSAAYTSQRDLDVVFEENEPGVSAYPEGLPSLSFLRHTKTAAPPYHHAAHDIPVSTASTPTSHAMPTFRRARAGTMPSFAPLPEEGLHRPPSTFMLTHTEVTSGRHRSGSLNLPPPNLDGYGTTWTDRTQPPSPSTEQLLQGDNDFSIARTLRSIGLEDDDRMHQQRPPSRSLLSVNRNRSYSVNAAAAYQQLQNEAEEAELARSRASSISKTTPYASPLTNFTRQQNRPRAASMGRMDLRSSSSRSALSGLWASQQQLSPLAALDDDDDESMDTNSYRGSRDLSLGDSELLANMLQKHAYDGLGDSTLQSRDIGPSSNGPVEPYMQFSQSTPTFRDRPSQMSMSLSTTAMAQQTATRSLWIGNIDTSVTVELLTQMFSSFGPIESVRLLLEKECAFVNFFRLEDAVRSKEDVLGRQGGRVGNCIVRIGFGKADASVQDACDLQPTRALWLGNIPATTTPGTLQRIFAKFGAIESVRVLSHKNCGFVNFELVESATEARDALLQNEVAMLGFSGARVGFAKVPPSKTSPDATPTINGTGSTSTAQKPKIHDKDTTMSVDSSSWLTDLWSTMQEYGAEPQAINLVKALRTTSSYFDSIPHVPELGANRKFDAGRLRDMRKRLDSTSAGAKEVEAIASECMDEIAGLSSDYIGNTVVQRIFEKSNESTRTAILERVAPHLAAIGVHKNGTWAAQKIIDGVKLPAQVSLIGKHLKPYVPPLLLDQFGNYAVQCCLRLGEANNQFIFDAMVEKLLNVAQGRFGARAMRTTLESQYITHNQKALVCAALTQNAVSLATNANGALLLTWLIESSNMENRLRLVASRLEPHLTQLCTHKLGSQMVLKLLDQEQEPAAQTILLEGLADEETLLEILSDQVRGLGLIQKVLLNVKSISGSSRWAHLRSKTCELLPELNGPGHEKLMAELSEAAIVYPSIIINRQPDTE